MTPSIFEATNDPSVVDEWHYGAKYGSEEASKRLKSHWDTWITERDFALIKAYGLNHVRIPIGYWAVVKNETETYPVGQYAYLKKAIKWARKYGIKVIIDLHGAPGSQNGYDNSGLAGPVLWHTDPENVLRTRAAIEVFVKDFVADSSFQDVVTSIELLNEPAGYIGSDTFMDVLKQYYYDGYGEIRWPWGDASQSSTLVTIHDAYHNASYWSGFMGYPGWNNVAIDTHHYTIFTPDEAAYTIPQHVGRACDFKNDLAAYSRDLWTFVGEWSPSFTDCAGSSMRNSHGSGAIFDGSNGKVSTTRSCKNLSGSATTFSTELKDAMRQYYEAAVDSFETAAGWIMWTWKTESVDDWSYMKGVQYGWIPKDPTARKYRDPCDLSTLPQGTPDSVAKP